MTTKCHANNQVTLRTLASIFKCGRMFSLYFMLWFYYILVTDEVFVYKVKSHFKATWCSNIQTPSELHLTGEEKADCFTFLRGV